MRAFLKLIYDKVLLFYTLLLEHSYLLQEKGDYSLPFNCPF